MRSIEALTADWNALSQDEQFGQWRSFLQDLDCGEGAFHRYYLVLMPLWDRGDVPELINDEQMEKYAAEMRAELAWELENLPPADLDMSELPY